MLRKNDITSKNVALSLGIFAIFLAVFLFVLLFWFILKLLNIRQGFCFIVRRTLKVKLFYSVWIRYMIESNLKITHNCIFFLAIGASFQSSEYSFATSLRIILLIVIVTWPIFAAVHLYRNRERLNERSFRTKFQSMYIGIRIHLTLARLYTSVFCSRRFILVICFLVLQDKQNWLILIFCFV